VPDLRKVRDAIGFRPRVSLDEVIRSVIDHLRSETTTGGTHGGKVPGHSA
jgi:nucleoside-diphosphate-sugar epimerase